MKFRKKPVVIEAMRFTGRGSEDAILAWIDGPLASYNMGSDPETAPIKISTLEGCMEASPGDWIIRGVQGEFYPCKPDIFEATYEPVPKGRPRSGGKRVTRRKKPKLRKSRWWR